MTRSLQQPLSFPPGFDGSAFEPINWVVELIRIGMGLDPAHAVTYNQMIPIPIDDGIFVAASILDSKPYAGSLSYAPGVAADGVTPLLLERQSLNVRDVLSIHIMSKNNEARRRRFELPMSLTNTLAAQVQDRWGFLIGKLPVGFADASETEGASRINRYVMTVAVLHAVGREAPVQYFDKFVPELITQQ